MTLKKKKSDDVSTSRHVAFRLEKSIYHKAVGDKVVETVAKKCFIPRQSVTMQLLFSYLITIGLKALDSE